MRADPLEWITAPLALLALIISVLSLWYSSLKGPDMVLCEKPRFVLEEIPREAFDHYVPHTLSSEARLLLVNNGTVSGVLRLSISFEPTIELKPFFDKAMFSFMVGSYHYESTMPPISISEKESCMITIRLSVEFANWKKYFAHDPVTKDEIHNILRKADWENKHRFDDFVAVLKPGMHIGKVNIRSNQTARTGLSGKIKMVQRSLDDELSIGVVTEDLTRNFRLSGMKWDTIIEQKTNELGRFLVGKSSVLEFDEPAPRLERQDNHEIRAKILALTQSEAKQLDIGKSTLHYLRRSASNNHPVHTYYKTRRKLRSESRDDTCRVKSAVEN